MQSQHNAPPRLPEFLELPALQIYHPKDQDDLLPCLQINFGPLRINAFAVETKLKLGIMTSSPTLISNN